MVWSLKAGTPVILPEAGVAVVKTFKEATVIAFVLIAAGLVAVLRGAPARSFRYRFWRRWRWRRS